MEAGAAFLLLLIVIFVGVVGGGLWLLMSTLRRRKLNPERDEIDGRMLATRANDAGADGAGSPNGSANAPNRNGNAQPTGAEQEQERPEHLRVGNEQSVRSVPRR